MSIDYPKKKAKGFSLVEVLLVLGIIAIMAISAFVLYPRVNAARQEKLQADEHETMLIRERIRAEAAGLPPPREPTQLVVPGEGVLKPGCSNKDDNCVPVYGTAH